MDTYLETNAAEALATRRVETVRQAYDSVSSQPRPEWVRGECPQCGAAVVSNCYYVGGRGYLIVHECWASLADKPACTYRKVL